MNPKPLVCRYCGAPLDAGPDDILAVCKRCGRVNWLKGSEKPLRAIPALPRSTLEDMFKRLVENDPELSRSFEGVLRVEIIYFPFYTGRVNASTSYEARVSIVYGRRECSGGKCREVSYTRVKLVTGVISGVYNALIPARKAASERIVETLANSILRLGDDKFEYMDRIDWNNADYVLAAELGADEVEKRLVAEACETLLEAAKRDALGKALRDPYAKTAVVEDIRAPCKIEHYNVDSLIYAPYARIYYATREGVYRAYMLAWDATPVEREEPFSDDQRMLLAAASGLVASGGLALGYTLASIYAEPFAGFALAALSLAIARDLAYGAANLTYRVESGRGGHWLKTLPATIRAVFRLRGTIIGRLYSLASRNR